ncbi:MAG: ABC transporter ATP-binding protein, partial [Desulfobacterales bacterium]|nr:ABC transporter ATP-binding protein [Desulfobacterales bacterium]
MHSFAVLSKRWVNLGVEFKTNQKKTIKALDGVNLSLKKGDRMAIIGESGSGKSILFLAMLGLLPGNARISGEIFFRGKGMASFSRKQYQHLRAWDIAYVPQGAGNALNPVIKVGHQVSERMRIHGSISKKKGMVMAATLLGQTGITNSHQRVHYYPHQFSGGMNQRVLLAMALAGKNPVLLADEPTKGLDDKTKKDVLNIFLKLDREAIAVVTHDLWFARQFARTIVVMYKGIILEQAPADSFFKAPYHPYSKALLNALPLRGILNPVIMSSHNGYGGAEPGDNHGGDGDQKDKTFSG